MTKINHLQVSEIYLSIQGESTYTGLPCVFVRLTGCDLRCAYCDSAFAFTGGIRMSIDEVIQKVESFHCLLVEMTGGEPLLQKAVLPLMKILCNTGKTILLETSGAHDISKVDSRVIRIVDFKCPSSGESDRHLFSNLRRLNQNDEVKFVIGSRKDFEWACDQVRRYQLEKKVRSVLFSPTFKTAAASGQTTGHEGLDSKLLVQWLLEENLQVRFQLQVHKYIWTPTQRGV